jgi:glutamyl-tRNA reductase
MNIVALGMSNKTAAVEVREKFAFAEETLPEALKGLRSQPGVSECVILSTCNRVEIYALLDGATPAVLSSFLHDFHGMKEGAEESLYVHHNEDALRHLCMVAAGIDSMIVGEPQVFGQVKEAYRAAQESGTTGAVFKSLFTEAFALVKKARTETDIGRANVSVSHAAVRLARQVLGDLKGRTVMILGAGEIAQLTVRNLIDSGVKQVLVSNRTFERAVRLAEAIKGTPIMLYEVADYLPRTDIVISSLGSRSWVIDAGDIGETDPSRPDGEGRNPLLVIDLGVPRNIDPEVGGLPGVRLYNIDDLKAVVEESLAAREKEAEKAVRMIDERVPEMWKKLDSAGLAPVILSLKETAESIRRDIFDSFSKSTGLAAQDRDAVEALSRSITNRIVHAAIVKLREHASALRYGDRAAEPPVPGGLNVEVRTVPVRAAQVPEGEDDAGGGAERGPADIQGQDFAPGREFSPIPAKGGL